MELLKHPGRPQIGALGDDDGNTELLIILDATVDELSATLLEMAAGELKTTEEEACVELDCCFELDWRLDDLTFEEAEEDTLAEDILEDETRVEEATFEEEAGFDEGRTLELSPAALLLFASLLQLPNSD